MEIKSVIIHFFSTHIANNGVIEEIGNRFMRPLNFVCYHVDKTSYQIHEKKLDSFYSIIECLALTIILLPFKPGIREALNRKSFTYFFGMSILLPIALIPVVITIGGLIKLVAWISPGVREKNWQLIRLQQFEKNPIKTCILVKREPAPLPLGKFHPSNCFTHIPKELKREILKFLPFQEILTMGKINREFQMVVSHPESNRLRIESLFPDKFIKIFGIEKLKEILSSSPVKINPQHDFPNDSTGEWAWGFRIFKKHPSLFWGVKQDRTLFIGIFYQHRLLIHSKNEYHKFYGVVFLIPDVNDKKNPLKFAYGCNHPTFHFNKMFITDDTFGKRAAQQKSLEVEKYWERLVTNQPCGVIDCDASGQFAEGPITALIDGVQKPIISLFREED